MHFQTIPERTRIFSKNLLRFSRSCRSTREGEIILRQVIRSATSIGANVIEAQHGGSKREFLRYYQIALRSSRETEYWLALCRDIGIIENGSIDSLVVENEQIAKILARSIITLKGSE